MMRALWWKEWMESRFKVLAGLALCAALHLVWIVGGVDWDAWFWGSLEPIAIFYGLVAAFLLGADALAGEREGGQLVFVLTRPLAPARLLAIKLAAGAAGLFLLWAAFWAGAYAAPDELVNRAYYNGAQIFDEVGWGWTVLAWWGGSLLALVSVTAVSAFVDNPVKAIMGALLLLIVGLLFYIKTVNGADLHGVNDTFWRALLFTPGFDDSGWRWRQVLEGEAFWLLAGWLCLVFVLVGVVFLAFQRSWQGGGVRLQYGLGAGYFGAAAISLALPAGWGSNEYGLAAGEVAVVENRQSLVGLALGDGMACVATLDELVFVDVGQPNRPFVKQRHGLEKGAFRGVVAEGSSVYALVARLDSLGVALWRDGVEVGVWNVTGGIKAGKAPKGYPGQQAMAPRLSGQRMFFGQADEKERRLVGIDLGAHPPALLCDFRLPLAEDEVWDGADTDGMALHWQRIGLDFTAAFYGDWAYLLTRRGVAVLDMSRPQAPRLARFIALDLRRDGGPPPPPGGRRSSHMPDRHWQAEVFVAGDRLYAKRIWPQEIAVFDLHTPDEPRLLRNLRWKDDGVNLLLAHGRIYLNSGFEVLGLGMGGKGFSGVRLLETREQRMARHTGGKRMGNSRAGSGLLERDGLLYALMGKQLAIFDERGEED